MTLSLYYYAVVVPPLSSSFSPDNSSSDFPLDSGTKKVQNTPSKFTQASKRSVFCIPIPGEYPGSGWVLLSVAYMNPNVPAIAPIFPAAADIPCQVDLSLAGKISAGTINVVALGPKLAKKKVNPYITTKPIRLACNQWLKGIASANMKMVMKEKPINWIAKRPIRSMRATVN